MAIDRQRAYEVDDNGLLIDDGYHLSSGAATPTHSGLKGDRYVKTSDSTEWKLDADGTGWTEVTTGGGGGGGGCIIDLGNNNIYKTVGRDITNLVLKEFIYAGATSSLTTFRALFDNDLLASATIEIYDFTNSLSIASITATSGGYIVRETFTITNLPTSNAIFQIRVSTGTGGNQDEAHFASTQLEY